MKKIIEFFGKVINFFANSYKSDQPQSSKRLFGSIGYISTIVFIAIWRHDLVNELLYVSATLIGLETIVTPFKKNPDDKG